MTQKLILTFLAGPAFFAACSSADSGSELAVPTYYEQVKPLMDERCANCHYDGGIGPFPLTSYEEIVAVSGLVTHTVEHRIMPPWPADKDCSSYANDYSLNDQEIDTIVSWIAAGAPPGDATQASPQPLSPAMALPRVDHKLTMPQPYVPRPPTGGIDDFRCFVVDWPESEPTYIKGFQVRPSNPAVAHHMVALILAPEIADAVAELEALDPDPGFPCGAGTRMNQDSDGAMAGSPIQSLDDLPVALMGAWVPGQTAVILPEGTGLRVDPGSKVLINMHYNTLAGAGSDQTEIDVMVVDEARPGYSVFVGTTDFLIAAGDPDAQASISQDLTELYTGGRPFTITNVGFHMHVRGKSGKLRIERANGASECLLEIPRWDFDWQVGYELTAPTRIDPGDRITTECRWDNSAQNQPVIDGQRMMPVDVAFGEGTLDEMCLGFIFLTPED